MKARYRLIRRGIRGGAFYSVDTTTGKRTSLGTADEDEAKCIIAAKNQAERQPVLNLQIARPTSPEVQRHEYAHLATGRDAIDGCEARPKQRTVPTRIRRL